MAASQETIGMVLVQEDEELHDHVIYYLSQNLIDVELHYSHVEKLALATIHAVQRLRHYILLRQTFIVVHINPFFILPSYHPSVEEKLKRINVSYNKCLEKKDVMPQMLNRMDGR